MSVSYVAVNFNLQLYQTSCSREISNLALWAGGICGFFLQVLIQFRMDQLGTLNFSDDYTISSTGSGFVTKETLKLNRATKKKSLEILIGSISPESLKELRDKNTESFKCLAQLTISRSSIAIHPLYEFPPVQDPGIVDALDFRRTETDRDSAQSTIIYSYKCKDFGIPIMQRVLKCLATSILDLRYFGLNLKQINAITAALTLNTCVKELILEENYLTAEGVFHISEMLRDNNCIEHLNLSRCNISVDCCTELVEGISTTQNVKELNLSKNNFGNDGLEKILKSLADNASIIKLDLSHNCLNTDVAEGLGKALAENESIRELNLSWNSFSSRKATYWICKGLSVGNKLKVLNLSWNTIRDEDAFYPIQRYLFKTKSLEHLDVSNNFMQGSVLGMLKRSILGNSSLISINVSSNLISPDQAYDLAQVFVEKTKRPLKLQYLDLENIVVNKDFIPHWQMMTDMGKHIRVGYVLGNYEIVGPNISKLLFNRLRYVTNKKKSQKSSREFGHLLFKLGDNCVSKQEFWSAINTSKWPKLIHQRDLLMEIMKIYTVKYGKLDIKQMIEDYYTLYPETTLPPAKKIKEKKVTKERNNEKKLHTIKKNLKSKQHKAKDEKVSKSTPDVIEVVETSSQIRSTTAILKQQSVMNVNPRKSVGILLPQNISSPTVSSEIVSFNEVIELFQE